MICRAILMGTVAHKIVKISKAGLPLTTLKILTSRSYVDSKGEKQDNDSTHFVHFFSRLSEMVSLTVHEGDLVYIEGNIQNKKIEGHYAYSVHATDIKTIPTPENIDQDNVGNKK